jgi:(p)ppGpp synthase/HD superfamily hydrolase
MLRYILSDREHIFLEAMKFAIKAHHGQIRKYSNEPYIIHPYEVALLVNTITNDIEVVIAALLHDTIEDTDVTETDICRNFGKRVERLVKEVTNISEPGDGSRSVRKEMERQHLAKASPEGKTIKIADIIHNIINIDDMIEYDKEFARTYLEEKRLLLEFLKEGNERFYKSATCFVECGFELLKDIDNNNGSKKPLKYYIESLEID